MPPSYEWNPDFLTLVYDSRRNVTVGIGGYAKPDLYYLPVSEYDGVRWVSRFDGSPANTPTFRHIGAAAFDSRRDVTIIFGGWVGNTEHALDELWEYDGTSWRQRTWTGAGPAKSVNVEMCFDPYRGRTICLTYAKTPGSWETWEWTGETWDRGPNLAGVDDTSTTRMVFDVARNKAFVYTTAYGDIFEKTYEYTPGASAAEGVWNNVPISGSPFEARIGASLVYDPYQRRVVRHGGRAQTNVYAYIDGTYTWDTSASRWDLTSFLPGDGRGGAGMCYDAQRVMMVLYGGTRVWVENGQTVRTTTYYDTWELVDNVPGDTWVAFGYAGPEFGSPQQPWNTLSEALTHAPAGGTIYLKAGASAENLTTSAVRSTPVLLRAWNGPVAIGK